jgi:hypothetical protein
MDLVSLAATPSTDGFTWRSPLPPYQQAGIARLLAEPGVLLADEMGLGKTIQAIGALRVLLQRGGDCGRLWSPTKRNASRTPIPPLPPRSKPCPGAAPGR